MPEYESIEITYISSIHLMDNKVNTFTAIVDLSRSNFSVARAPLFQLKSAT